MKRFLISIAQETDFLENLRMSLFFEAQITCPFCFEEFWIQIDPDGGDSQSMIQDCEVCCRPIDITATWNEDSQEFECTADRNG